VAFPVTASVESENAFLALLFDKSMETTTATPRATPKIESAKCQGWRMRKRKLDSQSKFESFRLLII
jgi:hypothetical protein